MIKLIPLKTQLNNRDKLLKLLKSDSELFCKTIRREGIILCDFEHEVKEGHYKGFNRTTYYFHSGYIINIKMINGEFTEQGISVYNRFNLKGSKIESKLIELGIL
jgi:hypothetical protein